MSVRVPLCYMLPFNLNQLCKHQVFHCSGCILFYPLPLFTCSPSFQAGMHAYARAASRGKRVQVIIHASSWDPISSLSLSLSNGKSVILNQSLK